MDDRANPVAARDRASSTAAALLAVLGTAPACSVDDLELQGRSCPCVGGWECDAATNVCVPAGGGTGATGATGGGGSGGSGGGGGQGNSGAAAVAVGDLHVVWTTPNSIFWSWAAAGTPDQLVGFELVTGTTEEDVRDRTGSAVVWNEAQNPELARYFLPNTGGDEPVVATTTDEHTVNTEYFGQLTAIDTANRRSVTNVASGRTGEAPTSTVVVFDDADTPGYSIPDDVVLSTRLPYAGTHHYDYLESCEAGENACFETLRRQGLSTNLSGISQGAFSTTAFIEFAVATEGPTPSYWSQVRIMTGTSGDTELWMNEGWTIRADGNYRLVQIPLRTLLGTDSPMPYEELARGLYEVGVGGNWQDGSRTMLDEIRVHW